MQKNSYTPPASVQLAASRGLVLQGRFSRGQSQDATSDLGKAACRAALLATGADASLSELQEMRSFFESCEKAYQPEAREADGGPTEGTISWLLSGGNAGRQWVNKMLMQIGADAAKGEDQGKVLKCEVAKVDSDLGIVFGYAIVCKQDGEEYFDTQGDFIPEQTMLEATAEFMAGDRVAKNMHRGEQVGQVVYGFPVTEEIAKSLGMTSDRTGFIVGMRPDQPQLLEKYRTGEYTGFSIGGRRIKDTVVDA